MSPLWIAPTSPDRTDALEFTCSEWINETMLSHRGGRLPTRQNSETISCFWILLFHERTTLNRESLWLSRNITFFQGGSAKQGPVFVQIIWENFRGRFPGEIVSNVCSLLESDVSDRHTPVVYKLRIIILCATVNAGLTGHIITSSRRLLNGWAELADVTQTGEAHDSFYLAKLSLIANIIPNCPTRLYDQEKYTALRLDLRPTPNHLTWIPSCQSRRLGNIIFPEHFLIE